MGYNLLIDLGFTEEFTWNFIPHFFDEKSEKCTYEDLKKLHDKYFIFEDKK